VIAPNIYFWASYVLLVRSNQRSSDPNNLFQVCIMEGGNLMSLVVYGSSRDHFGGFKIEKAYKTHLFLRNTQTTIKRFFF